MQPVGLGVEEFRRLHLLTRRSWVLREERLHLSFSAEKPAFVARSEHHQGKG